MKEVINTICWRCKCGSIISIDVVICPNCSTKREDIINHSTRMALIKDFVYQQLKTIERYELLAIIKRAEEGELKGKTLIVRKPFHPNETTSFLIKSYFTLLEVKIEDRTKCS